MAKVHIEFNAEADQKVWLHLKRGLFRAALQLEERVIRSISIGQPVRRLPSGHLIGLSPSRPGHPPHVLHGRLRQSITNSGIRQTASTRMGIMVGTNVEYAARLEYGFVGTDSLGRKVSQAPRPFLRRALRESLKSIGSLIAKGFVGTSTGRALRGKS